MNKTLSARAMSVIDQYLHFQASSADISIPYFNNKVKRGRLGLRVHGGKGSPKEIFEEAESLAVKNNVKLNDISADGLKKLLIDNDIGIDCSGFAYHVLNAESEESHSKNLDRNISFVKCVGFIGKIRCALRPVQNCDVATLAHDHNSRNVLTKDIQPGDMITMVGNDDEKIRDHILIVHEVRYKDSLPNIIFYSHSIAYPEDGVYGTGVRQGQIEINDSSKSIFEGAWSEEKLLARAKKSKTEVRRLKWF